MSAPTDAGRPSEADGPGTRPAPGILAVIDRWSRPDHIRLHADEMTAQEMRSVRAVLGAVRAEVSRLPEAAAVRPAPAGDADEVARLNKALDMAMLHASDLKRALSTAETALAEARAENARLTTLFREIAATSTWCPRCHHAMGHAPDCALAAILITEPGYSMGASYDAVGREGRPARKMADLTDAEVCRAFERSRVEREQILQRGEPFLDHLIPWPYRVLMRETGAPEKVAYRAMERAERRGLIECGVSLRTGWLTDAGRAIAGTDHEGGRDGGR